MLKKSMTALIAIAAGAGALGPAAHAADKTGITLAATDDTYASSSRKNTVFGADEKLAVGHLGSDKKVGFLRFVVPAGTKVTGAVLKLAVDGSATGKYTLNRVAGTRWSEKTLTAANAPALGAVVATATVTKAADVSFDLGKVVTGPGVYSFALQSGAKDVVTRFRSAESTTGPALRISTRTAALPAETIPPAVEDEDMPPPSASAGQCTTGALLVPSCGVLWGAAAGGFTTAPRDAALQDWEKLSGRTASIFHTYHKGDEPFPTKAEMAMARDTAHPRVLLINWKIAYGSDWARVAKGEQDARIDRFAARIKSSFPEKFFLVLNHEPENDVVETGTGWQAKDFAAMYRHTIQRLRAQGVGNAINVLAYMGNEKWMAKSWWKDLYPGDDVIDWIGLDSYVSAEQGAYHAGLFGDLLDRSAKGGQGFYDWAATKHASKPLMVAEWGVYHRVGMTADKTAAFRSVLPELARRKQIKAVVYFDTKHDDQGDRDISIDSTPANLAAFRKLAADKLFDVRIG
ncbi:hypothetical protein GCM10010435_71270 [Winogradskya consettensis]|uniref:GH26 domain-containing protein n=1 Tax=Winogradskya consettensis TaxID=113560 RepID=A0A919VVY8_9ACTN|nr:DNRLRE domain-containing protein [Actinoplanes consettensis]GIM71338.1 hypothetical protein Aco04nite_24780 [Actinoplanes consettensis]